MDVLLDFSVKVGLQINVKRQKRLVFSRVDTTLQEIIIILRYLTNAVRM
jgi:hypothetical protein